MNAFAKTDLLTKIQKEKFVAALEKSFGHCFHNYEFLHARHALDQLGLNVEKIDEIIKFFKYNGGYCDCEIMYNVILR